MDTNEYMKRSLELQERFVSALEALVKASVQQINVAHHSCGETTGDAQTKHPEVKQDAPTETKAEVKPKKVTADDARKALKAYASVEGNAAAMELLTSMGASSVSALAEQGEDKLRELIAKCEGK